jgi:hypothetical protein
MAFTVNLKNDVFQPKTGKLAPGMGIILLSWGVLADFSHSRVKINR